MIKFLLSIAAVLVLVGAAIAGLLAAFGWWGLTGLVVVLPVALWAMKHLLAHQCHRLITTPFQIKGAVLKGATTTVHEVTPAPPPGADLYTQDPSDLEDSGLIDMVEVDELAAEREEYVQEQVAADSKRVWYYIDVTIRPAPPTGKASDRVLSWDPMDLDFGLPELSPEAYANLKEDEICTIPNVLIYRDGDWEELDDNCSGEQRIRMHVGVEPGIPQLQFYYYFESLGSVTLPPANPAKDPAHG